MAKTLSEIRSAVVSNTGRTDKNSLIDTQCNNAIKLAVQHFPFADSCYTADDLSLTEDSTSISLSTLAAGSVDLSSFNDIVTARIVEASGSSNSFLDLKNRQWWDRNVINPEDNTKGWPIYGLEEQNILYFDRPLDSGLELRLRVSIPLSMTNDSDECPIPCLDLFVEAYATAMTFISISQNTQGDYYYKLALGSSFTYNGKVGGLLKQAMNRDTNYLAKKFNFEDVSSNKGSGVSILNNKTGSGRYGETDSWY